MKVKMIRDKGAYKKGEIHDLTNRIAATLLTEGFCIRVKTTENRSIKEIIEKTIETNSKNAEENKKEIEKESKDEPNQYGLYESDSQPDYIINKRKRK